MFKDTKDIFYNILSQLGLPTHCTQTDSGTIPGKLENGVLTPYTPTDNWLTFRFNTISTEIFESESRSYYELHVNIIGQDCDYYSNKLKMLLGTTQMLDYFSQNNISIISNSVPVVTSNVVIGTEWFNRRMLRFKFNIIETINVESDYFTNLKDLNIKEV